MRRKVEKMTSDEILMFEDMWHRMQEKVHKTAREKGSWEGLDSGNETVVASKLALIHSEVSEALEAVRHGFPRSGKVDAGNFEEELADAVIRIMDLAEELGVDVAAAVTMKAECNSKRPWKHGKSI